MPTQEVIMASATMRPARSAGGGYTEGRGLGLVIFAAVMVAVIGFFNLLDGIAAIANSHIFIGNAHYVVGDLRLWGWVMTIFGAVQLLAVFGVCMVTSWPAGSRWPWSGSTPSASLTRRGIFVVNPRPSLCPVCVF